jgi:hypothetical protein
MMTMNSYKSPVWSGNDFTKRKIVVISKKIPEGTGSHTLPASGAAIRIMEYYLCPVISGLEILPGREVINIHRL